MENMKIGTTLRLATYYLLYSTVSCRCFWFSLGRLFAAVLSA